MLEFCNHCISIESAIKLSFVILISDNTMLRDVSKSVSEPPKISSLKIECQNVAPSSGSYFACVLLMQFHNSNKKQLKAGLMLERIVQ